MSTLVKQLTELADAVNRSEYTLPETHGLADALLILIDYVKQIAVAQEHKQ